MREAAQPWLHLYLEFGEDVLVHGNLDLCDEVVAAFNDDCVCAKGGSGVQLQGTFKHSTAASHFSCFDSENLRRTTRARPSGAARWGAQCGQSVAEGREGRRGSSRSLQGLLGAAQVGCVHGRIFPGLAFVPCGFSSTMRAVSCSLHCFMEARSRQRARTSILAPGWYTAAGTWTLPQDGWNGWWGRRNDREEGVKGGPLQQALSGPATSGERGAIAGGAGWGGVGREMSWEGDSVRPAACGYWFPYQACLSPEGGMGRSREASLPLTFSCASSAVTNSVYSPVGRSAGSDSSSSR